jgi:hypothetical protein
MTIMKRKKERGGEEGRKEGTSHYKNDQSTL